MPVMRGIERVLGVVGAVPLAWTQRGPLSELYLNRSFVRPRPPALAAKVQERVVATQRLGEQPLWQGYGEGSTATRTPAVVSTQQAVGRFYSDLVRRLRPSVVVEFGSAFGVSGMHWLAGIEDNTHGHLYSYEPNEAWAKVAAENMRAVSARVTPVVGTFEEHVDATLSGQSIDLAFIDAIHTSAFVEPQFDLVAQRLAPGGVIVLDDIGFSPDMEGCWQRLSRRPAATVGTVTGRVGLLQLTAP